MKEQFVTFDLAKKLKKKGFECKYPFAMYNERGEFCPLFTSADHNEYIKSVFGNREYYNYDDFDEYDFIAPTIEQVLKWLRDDIGVSIQPQICRDGTWDCQITYIHEDDEILKGLFGGSSHWRDGNPTCEAAALVGIEYAVNHVI